MAAVRIIAAIVAILVGLLWIGQGIGLVRWPASSFMIDQGVWSFMGGVLVAVGLFLLLRRRRR